MLVSVPFWVVLGSIGLTLLLLAALLFERLSWDAGRRRRARVSADLQPILARLVEPGDVGQLEQDLRPLLDRYDGGERAAGAFLVIGALEKADPADATALRRTLLATGIVAFGERSTRRRSPWRRALACEALGKMGDPGSAPVLLERLDDRRPEVRVAAVQALGEIGSPQAAPALASAFLERRCAPTNIVNKGLRRLGPAGAEAFLQGTRSQDTIVRISACFGVAATAALDREAAVRRLAEVLRSDPEERVRTAAARGLGMIGGDDAPTALIDAARDSALGVQRAVMSSLGAFDDPAVIEALVARADDDDRETALRSAESLRALSERSRARDAAREWLATSQLWSTAYTLILEEVGA